MTDDTSFPQVVDWQTWPLCCRYAVVLVDSLRVEVREAGVVRSKALHLVLGMHAESGHEVLGLWLEQNAATPFWLEVCEELKDRGVERIRVVMGDGLKGLPEAIHATFPATPLQASPVPLIRHSLSGATRRDRRPLAAALRPIYAAASAGRAQALLDALAAGRWGGKYPSMVERWRAAWQPLLPLYALPRAVRRLAIVAVDTIENLHLGLGRMIERHGCFAGDAAAIEFAWRAQRDVMRRWSRSARGAAIDGRLAPALNAAGVSQWLGRGNARSPDRASARDSGRPAISG